MSQSQKNKVPTLAFIEEISNWELTLSREQKKLKSLRSRVNSRIQINEIDILINEIEGEVIQYRKLKDANKLQYLDIIQEYNQASKRFMDIMENVGNLADKIDSVHIETAEELNEGDLEDQIKKGGYLDETYTYTVSKKNKYLKNDRSPLKVAASKTMSKKSSLKNVEKKTMNKTLTSHQNTHQSNGRVSKIKTGRAVSNILISKPSKGNEELDSWEIRYQLKEIKSMMGQIQNEIKFHSHEDIEADIAKMAHNNKKMTLEVKSLREDSQFIVARIQKLKEELMAEKQIQSQMIHEFENPQKASRKTKAKSTSESIKNVSEKYFFGY